MSLNRSSRVVGSIKFLFVMYLPSSLECSLLYIDVPNTNIHQKIHIHAFVDKVLHDWVHLGFSGFILERIGET